MMETKTVAWLFGVFAGGLFVIGLMLGMRTIHDYAGNDCGSAFKAATDYGLAESCAGARSDAQPLTWVFLLLALTVGVAAMVVAGTLPVPGANVKPATPDVTPDALTPDLP